MVDMYVQDVVSRESSSKSHGVITNLLVFSVPQPLMGKVPSKTKSSIIAEFC